MKLFDVYPLYPVEPVRGRGCFVTTPPGPSTSTSTADTP